MKKAVRRRAACLAVLLAVIMLASVRSHAAPEIYFTAANEDLLELSDDTMPFWSKGLLYVSSRVFEGTSLGVGYVKSNNYGLSVLYSDGKDLRFDLENRLAIDKEGNFYDAVALEKGGIHFFPLAMVCNFFGLVWTVSNTDTAPLIHIRSTSAILDDASFIDAASTMMATRYAAYIKVTEESEPPSPSPTPPAPPAVIEPPPDNGNDAPEVNTGQRISLVIASRSREGTLAVTEILAAYQAPATFLVPAVLMEDMDLLRALVAGGYGIGLLAEGGTEEAVRQEVGTARECLWQGACYWLDLVWYQGDTPMADVWEELGCVPISVRLDRSGSPPSSRSRAAALLTAITRYKGDLPVYLGKDELCTGGLAALLEGLEDNECSLHIWKA